MDGKYQQYTEILWREQKNKNNGNLKEQNHKDTHKGPNKTQKHQTLDCVALGKLLAVKCHKK